MGTSNMKMKKIYLSGPIMDEQLDAATLARMQTVLDFLEMLSTTFQDYQHLSPQTLQRFVKMGGKVARFLGPNDKEPA